MTTDGRDASPDGAAAKAQDKAAQGTGSEGAGASAVPDGSTPFAHASIRFYPIFHGRLEFAAVVRAALLAQPPAVLAVELPGTWRAPVLQAINRLPFLSLVMEEGDDGHLFLPVEPTDALVEALRTARELSIPVEFIDLDVAQYPLHHDAAPDSHALRELGYARFMQTWYAGQPHLTDAAQAHPAAADAADLQRETMMAHALQQIAARLAEDGEQGKPDASAPAGLACVLGAAHLPGLLNRLATPQPRPFARAKPRQLTLLNWSLQSSREFMTEAPFLAAHYERRRWHHGMDEVAENQPQVPDVPRMVDSERLLHEAAEAYQEKFHEAVGSGRLRTIGRFAAKYARVDGKLVPDLYQLVTAARGVVDDDYGYEVWDRGSHYPWQDGSGLLPTVELGEEFATVEGRRLRLRRKIRRTRPRLASFSDKKRLRETLGGRWKTQWSGRTICSYPPEDIVIEDFGRYLRAKAKGLYAADHSRVEPFTVSLKDGIDVRETLRHWHEQRLYVREVLPLRGEIGAVVMIFDEDRPEGGGREAAPQTSAEARYPWCVTWLGEHEQESDMAFYATAAGQELVGPGISRCHYGGFLMTHPPRRLADVWSDPVFDAAESKPERLLLAALDYAKEPNVLYVAEKPPRGWFHSLAARMGRKLIYLPQGALSPGTLGRLRHFHVLDSQQVRDYADEYIRR